MHHHQQQPPAPPAHLDRIYVGASGAVKALYADGRVLLTSSSGASFTHVAPEDGSRTTQLCEACLHRWRPLLAELLAFRNQHVDMPAWPRWLVAQLLLHQRRPPTFVAGYPITAVSWPASAQDAFRAGLVELLPGQAALALHSVCRAAQLVLERSGLRFSVCYPLLLARDDAAGDGSCSSSRYSYCQHTQVFSRSQCPRRWLAALAVAAAAADLAAQGCTPAALQTQQQQPQLLLDDVTNTHTAGAAVGGQHSSSSWAGSPSRQGGGDGGSGGGGMCRQREWAPRGEPGSPSKALYDVAEQQQREQEEEQLEQLEHSLFLPTPSLSPHRSERRDNTAGARAGGGPCSTAALPPPPPPPQPLLQQCVTQLPISPELLQTLPQWARQQQDDADTAGSSIASSVAQVLGARQQQRPGDNGSSWWLQPSVLLPADELLLMVWSREATLIFQQEACEVEAWLHGDDSCMTSFHGGAFIKHLRPAAAAAAAEEEEEGAGRHTQQGPGDDGHDGATSHLAAWGDTSRVYAAAHLPADLSVSAALQPDGPGGGGGAAGARVLLPLGRVAAEALKLRSTMVRVQQDLQQQEQQQQRQHAPWLADSSTGCALLLPPPDAWQPTSWRGGSGDNHGGDNHGGATQLSLQVVEEQEVPGLGCFSAYADGRVRVVFEDRTLLGLDGCRSTVSVTLPDGSVHRVAARAPLGLQAYVQPALEFASWAMHTPVQRAAALRTQALVASECRSSARMAAICEWAGSSPQRVVPPLPSPSGPRPDTAAQLSEGRPAAAATGRQAAVEQCLAANALLLERL